MWRCFSVTVLCLFVVVSCGSRKPDVPVEKKSPASAEQQIEAGRDERTVDPAYTYKIIKHETPQRFQVDTDSVVVVRLLNTSNRTWEKMGAIRLGCIWTDQSGEALDGMTSVAPVLRDTPPGESVPFKCRVKAPPEPGQFFLIWDLHEKGVGDENIFFDKFRHH